MPLEDDDKQRVDEAIAKAGIDGSTKLLVLNASESHKLGPVTVICMILNRTVGKLSYRLAISCKMSCTAAPLNFIRSQGM